MCTAAAPTAAAARSPSYEVPGKAKQLERRLADHLRKGEVGDWRTHFEPYPELLDAEFQVAEVAWRRAAENVQQTYEKPEKCQVCSLSRDKWFCRLPLYLNARDEPVNLPGSFCSKACFERI